MSDPYVIYPASCNTQKWQWPTWLSSGRTAVTIGMCPDLADPQNRELQTNGCWLEKFERISLHVWATSARKFNEHPVMLFKCIPSVRKPICSVIIDVLPPTSRLSPCLIPLVGLRGAKNGDSGTWNSGKSSVKRRIKVRPVQFRCQGLGLAYGWRTHPARMYCANCEIRRSWSYAMGVFFLVWHWTVGHCSWYTQHRILFHHFG